MLCMVGMKSGMREEGVGISVEIEKLWCLVGVIFERKGKLE